MELITFNSFFRSVFLDEETVYSIFGYFIQNEKVPLWLMESEFIHDIMSMEICFCVFPLLKKGQISLFFLKTEYVCFFSSQFYE